MEWRIRKIQRGYGEEDEKEDTEGDMERRRRKIRGDIEGRIRKIQRGFRGEGKEDTEEEKGNKEWVCRGG